MRASTDDSALGWVTRSMQSDTSLPALSLLWPAGTSPETATSDPLSASAADTHFPWRESTRPAVGRLDDEAERFGAIFRQATRRSRSERV